MSTATRKNLHLGIDLSIFLKSAPMRIYAERRDSYFSKMAINYLELSEVASENADTSKRLQLWQEDTANVLHSSVENFNTHIKALKLPEMDLSNILKDVGVEFKIYCPHPFIRNYASALEKLDTDLASLQLSWLNSDIDDFTYNQAKARASNILENLIKRLHYLTTESGKRNKGLFSSSEFPNMLSSDIKKALTQKKAKTSAKAKVKKADLSQLNDDNGDSDKNLSNNSKNKKSAGTKKDVKEAPEAEVSEAEVTEDNEVKID